jgi:DNA replication protein DnaC
VLIETMQELTAHHLSPMAWRLKAWMDDPENAHKSHLECVQALVDAQSQNRANLRARNFLKSSGLPDDVSVAGVKVGAERGLPPQLWANLRACDWVRGGQSLVITGPRWSGKTYLMGALAREARLVVPKLTALYGNVHDLLVTCETEADPKKRQQSTKRLTRTPLLALDEFAAQPFTPTQCYLLQHIIDERHRRKLPTMVASPLAFEDWKGRFDDPTAADAIFYRLFEKAQHIELKAPAKRR